MKEMNKILSCLLASALLLAIFAGCMNTTTSETSGTTPAGTTGETTQKSVPFKINVLPEQLKGMSIAGQQIVYLITITEEGGTSKTPVEIAAKAESAAINIIRKSIVAGQVAEVIVVPENSSVGKTIELTITGSRDEFEEKKILTFEVIEGADDRKDYALEQQAKFIKWLAEKHPELGITSTTKWTGTIVSPQWLVVSHYLFFSDEWEMHIEWHIMVAPNDWVRIDLRHRSDETKPSYAFEITSITANDEPKAIEVPGEIWR
ncbi:MAG: hypothetical protein VB070_07160 [Clostridiaceae bacterium]|nr:hypothetical protein [Clostridiaceae bacterium]